MSGDRPSANDVTADTTFGRSRRALLAGAAGAAGALAANSLARPPEAQASSDNQFTALGPAVIGFQTDSTNIDVGAQIAGNTVGVEGSGPVGVRGTGVSTGVQGVGTGGRGGSFTSSDLNAQIHLSPQGGPGGAVIAAKPTEFKDPSNALPLHGSVGDMWFTEADRETGGAIRGSGTLWLCVSSSTGRPGTGSFKSAMWRQVLLGSPFPGKAVAFG